MPRMYAVQFRAMVVEQVRSGRSVGEVAGSAGVSEATVYR
jgi:transposase